MGDYGNVQKAYNKARKCKRHRKDVLIFTKDKEENLDKDIAAKSACGTPQALILYAERQEI